MMDYVGFGSTFATDQLARLGKPATDYFFNRCQAPWRDRAEENALIALPVTAQIMTA